VRTNPRSSEADRPGQATYDQGKYQQALPIAQQALEIREKEFGPEHPDTAEALSQLARLNDVLGILQPSRIPISASTCHPRKDTRPEHRDTARSLNNLANLYQIIGAYAKAEQLYLLALAIREKNYGKPASGHRCFAK